MAFEYRCRYGLVSLVQVGGVWKVDMNGTRVGRWPTAQQAVEAIARRSSGLAVLDKLEDADIPQDLLRWTPLSDDL